MILQRDIHLLKIKYYEDTRPQFQLSDVQEQYDGLCTILQGASIILQTILLGVGGTTYTHWNFSRTWVLILRVNELASKLHYNYVNYAAKLVHTRHALSSTIINSH